MKFLNRKNCKIDENSKVKQVITIMNNIKIAVL